MRSFPDIGFIPKIRSRSSLACDPNMAVEATEFWKICSECQKKVLLRVKLDAEFRNVGGPKRRFRLYGFRTIMPKLRVRPDLPRRSVGSLGPESGMSAACDRGRA